MTATPSPRRSSDPDWKQFIRLGEQLVQQSTTKSQCLLIEQLVQQLLGGNARVWLSHPFYPLPNEDSEELDLLPSAPAPDLVQRARLEARSLYSNGTSSTDKTPDHSHKSWIAAVPIVTNQRLLGVLQVERNPDAPLDSKDIVLLDRLVGHAASALEISYEKKINQWRLQQLSLVRKVSAQIASVLNIDLLYEHITGLIQSTFHYYYVAIFTLFRRSSHAEVSRFCIEQRQPTTRAGFHDPNW